MAHGKSPGESHGGGCAWAALTGHGEDAVDEEQEFAGAHSSGRCIHAACPHPKEEAIPRRRATALGEGGRPVEEPRRRRWETRGPGSSLPGRAERRLHGPAPPLGLGLEQGGVAGQGLLGGASPCQPGARGSPLLLLGLMFSAPGRTAAIAAAGRTASGTITGTDSQRDGQPVGRTASGTEPCPRGLPVLLDPPHSPTRSFCFSTPSPSSQSRSSGL